jgi:hypothetical protein
MEELSLEEVRCRGPAFQVEINHWWWAGRCAAAK